VRSRCSRGRSVLLAAVVCLAATRAWAGGAGVVPPAPPAPAAPPPEPAPPAAAAPAPPIAPAPAPSPPVTEPVVGPGVGPMGGPLPDSPPGSPPVVERAPVTPVPTADATAAASDHDAVVGHVGLEVRRIDASPFGLDLGPNGCPSTEPQPCAVSLGALSVRYWQSRNLAVSGGLALGFGGGREAGAGLDSYAGIGPIVGMSLLLGNWRHLAVSASPEASWIWFKPGGSGATTKVITLRAALEGELHFGFVGVPALSIGLVAGLGFRYVGVGDDRVWAVGVVGPGSVRDVLSDLFVRYYL
jgi:hypothetical protein